MTLKPMYPAAVNSPGTELAADITATATEITVLSTNGLPPAPNLLTLGSDETAETVRYTKVDGTKLTVERGFQGVAKSWSAGTRVARYFTAYDHDTFRENIEEIDAETSGAEHADLTLNVGLQIVESAQDTPFQFGEMRGGTRINLNGKEGNFDYRGLLPTFFGTGEIVSSSGPISTKAMKVVCNRTDTAHFGARYELEIDRSKHYIAVAYMDNVSCDAPVYFSIAEMKDTGYTSLRLSAKIAKGSGMQYLYTTISPAQMENREKLVYYFRGEGTSGAEFRIGPFAFYEITAAEYDAIAKLTPEQVAERYPYVDSMTNVTNPYAIVTGGNLLPSFYHMGAVNGASVDIQSAYEIDLMTSNTLQFVGMGNMEAKHKSYRIDFDSMGTGVKCYFNEQIAIDSLPIRQHEIDASGATIEIGDDTKYLGLFFGNMSATGSFKIKNPMLIPGTDPKPFVPQQRSILAFETELAAHPVNGSNPDTLFMGDDGLPYVLEPWKKVTLDGSLDWRYDTAPKTDFKTVKVVNFAPDRDTSKIPFGTKYTGQLLGVGGASLGADIISGSFWSSTSGNHALIISIANTDSGWGPDYEPSREEIKAYFLGWKMGVVGQPRTVLYNGEGGRVWYKISMCTVNAKYSLSRQDWVEYDVPTYPAGVDSVGTYNYPYRLQYLKAKPTVEPVRNYEMGATLSAGSNMVEVGSGIVIRERANPKPSSGLNLYGINHPGAYGVDANLKNKAREIVRIYRNQAKDALWFIYNNASVSYGNVYADIYSHDYDPTAIYHVTYTMLDPTLAAPFSGTVAANLRGTVSDLVQDVGDIGRRLSVSEVRLNSITSDLNSPLDWITATLLNGWKSVSGRPVQYAKDALGFVHFRGALDSGEAAKAVGTDIFILPVSYRPPRIMGVPTVTYGSPQDIQAYAIDVGNGGSVRVTMENTRRFVHLETLSFYAGGGTT
ncbi:hypothetical protein [Paenibacillus dendritiformis]|uniref:hypothetical protein n=1 Tax=Paenibacillus dendritiformis TaxID=130049 RepID=UPI00387E0461